MKNLVSDGQTAIENFRQMLRKFRDDFVSDVIVTVQTNVFRILAEVESIEKDVKEVKENVKEVGE
jgi:CRISPR/Cas system-associated protein endoribonuclease Cas2